MIWRVLLLLLFGGFSVGSVAAGTLSLISQDRWVTVKHVIDGDTFVTREGEKIRLLGINTPEIQHESSPEQPYGNEAKQALEHLLQRNQVRLHFDKDKKDDYGRTLAHIYLKDGRWVNGEMVSLGLAHVYTFAPNFEKANDLLLLEQKAREGGVGFWSHARWKVLSETQLKQKMLGTFRLVAGKVTALDKKKWHVSIGNLTVTIPKASRKLFSGWKFPRVGEEILVRGKLRISKKNKWFLSIYTPSDIEVL